jgi:hypothetical protein
MFASQKLAEALGEGVVRPELNCLKAEIPLDTQANISNEPHGDIIRWSWKGMLLTDDKLSVRVSLGRQGDAIVRAKVRAYYGKALASIARPPHGKRNRQEIYTGKTRRFAGTDADSAVTFTAWLKNELRGCTAAFQRRT